MPRTSGYAASLTGVPAEMLLDIYQYLDPTSILNLSLTNKRFMNFFEKRRTAILLPALTREYSPFDELLQVYTASFEDLDVKDGLYQPRRVVFKRFVGDGGQVLAPQSEMQGGSRTRSAEEGFRQVANTRRPAPSQKPLPDLQTFVLTERDLVPLLRQCKVVRQWEALFPQMRWYHDPASCRSLRPQEAMRFRRALYRWWLYSIYFHGDTPRPRVGLPEPFVNDTRTSQMRHHSTSELLEMMDLLETVKDLVLHYICPRLDPDQDEAYADHTLIEYHGRSHSLATSWTDQSRWSRIVKTYCKLPPDEILHYFNNIYSYPRKRLLTSVRIAHATFSTDQESMQLAIRCALDERRWLDGDADGEGRGVPALAEEAEGGILDWEEGGKEEQRGEFGGDGGDGRVPGKAVRGYSMMSPRGDDGAFLEERMRQYWSGYEARATATVP